MLNPTHVATALVVGACILAAIISAVVVYAVVKGADQIDPDN